MKSRLTWVIGVSADTDLYTPCRLTRREAIENSWEMFEAYGACKTACDKKNKEKKHETA